MNDISFSLDDDDDIGEDIDEGEGEDEDGSEVDEELEDCVVDLEVGKRRRSLHSLPFLVGV